MTSNPGCRLRDGNRRPHLHKAGFLRLALVELLGYLLQNRLVLPVLGLHASQSDRLGTVVVAESFWTADFGFEARKDPTL